MLNDTEYRDLLERHALVQEMASHPGFTLLADRAKVNLFSRQRALIQGQAKDWEDYLTQTAWMEGVSFILDLPGVMEREMERETLARREAEAEAEAEDEDV